MERTEYLYVLQLPCSSAELNGKADDYQNSLNGEARLAETSPAKKKCIQERFTDAAPDPGEPLQSFDRYLDDGATNTKGTRLDDTTNLSRHSHEMHAHRKPERDGRVRYIMMLMHSVLSYTVLMDWLLSFACFCLLLASLWAVAGTDALPPNGPVFVIFVLYVAAMTGGWMMEPLCLPPLLGQLLSGILIRNLPLSISVTDAGNNIRFSNSLRMLALTVILLRAGLGLDPTALSKLKRCVILLAVVPVFAETTAYAVLTHFFMDFPWKWGFLLGFVLAAVSPAVIVPSMLNLQAHGLGVDKGIPTLIMAAASVDDVIAIAGVGVMLSIIFSSGGASNIYWQIAQGPVELVGGITYGVVIGIVLWFIPAHNVSDPVAARSSNNKTNIPAFRTALLCGCGLFAVFGAQRMHLSGAGALGCLTVAFVAAIKWRTQDSASLNYSNELLSSAWRIVLQPLLFALIGAEIALERIEINLLGTGLIVLSVALIFRMAASVVAVSGSNLSCKEKLFVAVAWLPKATVQAAVGPLAYDTARKVAVGSGNVVGTFETELGLKVLTFAVMVILLTAPLGAIGINLSARKLLDGRKKCRNNSLDIYKNVPNTATGAEVVDVAGDVIHLRSTSNSNRGVDEESNDF